MLPSFVIIGAMKCGTSSLFRYVASHPDATPSSLKETDFFKTDADFAKGAHWYRSLFAEGDGLAFEASPNYAKRHLFAGVPARMHSVLPDAKLIYVLRDPVDRIVSHYTHNYAHGRESRSLADAVREDEGNYVQTSRYHFQLEAFLEFYPRERLLIVESERLLDDTDEVMRRVLDFVELPPRHDRGLSAKRFHVSSKKRRRSAAEQWLAGVSDNRLWQVGIDRVAAPFRKSIETAKLSPAQRASLVETLAPDVEKLRAFSGLEFSRWAL